jgi:hypothetical protein
MKNCFAALQYNGEMNSRFKNLMNLTKILTQFGNKSYRSNLNFAFPKQFDCTVVYLLDRDELLYIFNNLNIKINIMALVGKKHPSSLQVQLSMAKRSLKILVWINT